MALSVILLQYAAKLVIFFQFITCFPVFFIIFAAEKNFETMSFENISAEAILFFILYGITGVVSLIAAVYLLLRRGITARVIFVRRQDSRKGRTYSITL